MKQLKSDLIEMVSSVYNLAELGEQVSTDECKISVRAEFDPGSVSTSFNNITIFITHFNRSDFSCSTASRTAKLEDNANWNITLKELYNKYSLYVLPMLADSVERKFEKLFAEYVLKEL